MTVAGIVASYPATANVFQQYGIDFCCHGDEQLGAACERLELQADHVQADLNAALKRSEPDTVDWSAEPAEALIEHLLERYHAGGYALMDQISTLMEKVLRVHGERWGQLVPDLAEAWFGLARELTSHFRKEEVVLFPMMQAMLAGSQGPPLDGPLAVMAAEHEDAGAGLDAITQLTDKFTPPEGACRSVTALWDTLRLFDLETRRHIHLESHVLFPAFDNH